MKRLRQKLGVHGSWVETVRSIGYCVIQAPE
jgi:DNA-binding response OmpR family regulator